MSTEHEELLPYGVTFTDGYYSVRQARGQGDARELSRERHPQRVVKSIKRLIPLPSNN